MCRPLIFIVLQVLALENVTSYPFQDYIIAYIPIEEFSHLSSEDFEAIPVPYYDNALFYNPWYFQNMMMQSIRSPYQQTTGPVSFGGQVKAKGAVTITGDFGNDDYGTSTSYSASPTSLGVTSQPALSTTSSFLVDTTFPTSTTLPTIITLPAVTLPSATISHTFIDTVPSTVSVPTTPMPFIVVTTTVPSDAGLNGNVASPVKFSGMVPASGRVKISAHFC